MDPRGDCLIREKVPSLKLLKVPGTGLQCFDVKVNMAPSGLLFYLCTMRYVGHYGIFHRLKPLSRDQGAMLDGADAFQLKSKYSIKLTDPF